MRNITLLTVCVFIGIQTVSGDDVEIQSLISECETKGIEKRQAKELITSLASTDVDVAIKAINVLNSKKLSRPIAGALLHPNLNVAMVAIDRLFELKDPQITDKVIQVLENNIVLRDGSERATSHEVFVIELVKLLNVLAGSNYQLDIYNDSEARRKEIVKAAKEKLAKRKEMESKGMVFDHPVASSMEKEGCISMTNFSGQPKQ
ncbi:MAG: hypothetical protein PHW65_02905 [Dehalococcoidales bacterium]|nr:hypothetical protein [Dehalococcoidales bacterium]